MSLKNVFAHYYYSGGGGGGVYKSDEDARGGVYKSDEDARQKVKIHLVAIRTPNGASDQ